MPFRARDLTDLTELFMSRRIRRYCRNILNLLCSSGTRDLQQSTAITGGGVKGGCSQWSRPLCSVCCESGTLKTRFQDDAITPYYGLLIHQHANHILLRGFISAVSAVSA
jgi:hypothetical protein